MTTLARGAAKTTADSAEYQPRLAMRTPAAAAHASANAAVWALAPVTVVRTAQGLESAAAVARARELVARQARGLESTAVGVLAREPVAAALTQVAARWEFHAAAAASPQNHATLATRSAT